MENNSTSTDPTSPDVVDTASGAFDNPAPSEDDDQGLFKDESVNRKQQKKRCLSIVALIVGLVLLVLGLIIGLAVVSSKNKNKSSSVSTSTFDEGTLPACAPELEALDSCQAARDSPGCITCIPSDEFCTGEDSFCEIYTSTCAACEPCHDEAMEYATCRQNSLCGGTEAATLGSEVCNVPRIISKYDQVDEAHPCADLKRQKIACLEEEDGGFRTDKDQCDVCIDNVKDYISHEDYCTASVRGSNEGPECRGNPCGLKCMPVIDEWVQCEYFFYENNFRCCRSETLEYQICLQNLSDRDAQDCLDCTNGIIAPVDNVFPSASEYCQAFETNNCTDTCGETCAKAIEDWWSCQQNPLGDWSCDEAVERLEDDEWCHENLEAEYESCLADLEESIEQGLEDGPDVDPVTCRKCFDRTLMNDYGTVEKFCFALGECERACGATCATALEDYADCAHLPGGEFECAAVSTGGITPEEVGCPLEWASFAACEEAEYGEDRRQCNLCSQTVILAVGGGGENYCNVFDASCTEVCGACRTKYLDTIRCLGIADC